MSSSKLDRSGFFQPLASSAPPTKLTLPANAVRLSKHGIEFLSAERLPTWTEMTVAVESPRGGRKIHATGVVIECNGSRQTGYSVSMLFMNLSRQSQAQLDTLAFPARG
jgi:hypothetical protein